MGHGSVKRVQKALKGFEVGQKVPVVLGNLKS